MPPGINDAQAGAGPPTVRQRAVHEATVYTGLSLYLFVCFSAILLYKAAVLAEHGIGYTPFGLAAVKALVLGKFIVLGHLARIGERKAPKSLISGVLHRSAIFLLLIIAVSILEVAIVGLVHGHMAKESLSTFFAGRWQEIGASSFLIWLILLPYFAVRQTRLTLGEDAWRGLLRGQH